MPQKRRPRRKPRSMAFVHDDDDTDFVRAVFSRKAYAQIRFNISIKECFQVEICIAFETNKTLGVFLKK